MASPAFDAAQLVAQIGNFLVKLSRLKRLEVEPDLLCRPGEVVDLVGPVTSAVWAGADENEAGEAELAEHRERVRARQCAVRRAEINWSSFVRKLLAAGVSKTHELSSLITGHPQSRRGSSRTSCSGNSRGAKSARRLG